VPQATQPWPISISHRRGIDFCLADRDRNALEAAVRDGLITHDQYEALRSRLEAEKAHREAETVGRKAMWVGLVLLAIVGAFLAFVFLDLGQRIVLLGVAVAITAGISAWLLRDPGKTTLSRGLLGLTIFEASLLLLLATQDGRIPLEWSVAILATATSFGLILGIYEDSAWLASPSVASLYLYLYFSGVMFGYDFWVPLLIVSVAIALGVVGLTAAWHAGRLVRLRQAYLRRRASLGQLARAHLVLFDLYLAAVLPFVVFRSVPSDTVTFSLLGLVPFLVALVAVLYVRWSSDPKLMTVSSFLLVAVAWIFVFVSGRFYGWPFYLWPTAVIVTAAVLIYLGVRRQRATAPSARAPIAPRT